MQTNKMRGMLCIIFRMFFIFLIIFEVKAKNESFITAILDGTSEHLTNLIMLFVYGFGKP